MSKFEEIDVEIKFITEKAILIDDGMIQKWIPLSLIKSEEKLEKGMTTTISVCEWFLEKEGLV